MDTELRGVLSAAQAKGAAIGHFNISDVAIWKGVVGAAQDMQTAVIVGVSEGERTYLGTRQIAAVIRSLDDEIDVPVFLNATIPIPSRARWRRRKPASILSSPTSPRCLSRKTWSKQGRRSKLSRASIPRSSSKGRSATLGPGRRSTRRRRRRARSQPLRRPGSSYRRPALTLSPPRSAIVTECRAVWSKDQAANISTLGGSPRSRPL